MYNIIYAILILLMYFISGKNKLLSFKNTVNGFKNKFIITNLPAIFYKLTIVLVILLEIIAPIIIIYSLYVSLYIKYAYYSSISLAIFTALATLLYHFPPYGADYYAFMKNITAIGGLLLLSTLFIEKNKIK